MHAWNGGGVVHSREEETSAAGMPMCRDGRESVRDARTERKEERREREIGEAQKGGNDKPRLQMMTVTRLGGQFRRVSSRREREEMGGSGYDQTLLRTPCHTDCHRSVLLEPC